MTTNLDIQLTDFNGDTYNIKNGYDLGRWLKRISESATDDEKIIDEIHRLEDDSKSKLYNYLLEHPDELVNTYTHGIDFAPQFKVALNQIANDTEPKVETRFGSFHIPRTIDSLTYHCEKFLTVASIIPIIPGMLKMGMGLIQLTGALIAQGIDYFNPHNNAKSRAISERFRGHFYHGLPNIGRGLLEAIPGVGLFTQIYRHISKKLGLGDSDPDYKDTILIGRSSEPNDVFYAYRYHVFHNFYHKISGLGPVEEGTEKNPDKICTTWNGPSHIY